MFADDRPDYPMTFFLRAHIDGRLDPVVLRAAAAKALTHHPLLASTIDGGNARATGAKLVWRPLKVIEPYVDAAAEGVPWRFPRGTAHLDITTEAGLRLFVRGPWLWLQIHHAAADAIAATQFLEDLLIAYASLCGLDLPERSLDVSLLDQRAGIKSPLRESWRRLLPEFHRIWIFFSQFPAALAPMRGEPVPRDRALAQPPDCVEQVLTEADVQNLRSEAHRHGATVNDLLLADLFRSLDSWNQEQAVRRPLRLAMPINMRLPRDRQMPAANVVSMCFLDRSGSALDAPDLLLGIAAETRTIKQGRLGNALLHVAQLAAKFPSGLKTLMTPRYPWTCSSSAVLSNLGTPYAASTLPRNALGQLRAGPLTLTSVELLPPIRPQTRAAIGVVSYAREMRLTLHYDSRWLSPVAARALLHSYVAALRSSMAAAAANSLSFDERLAASRSRRTGQAFRSLPIGKNVGYGTPRETAAVQKFLRGDVT